MLSFFAKILIKFDKIWLNLQQITIIGLLNRFFFSKSANSLCLMTKHYKLHTLFHKMINNKLNNFKKYLFKYAL